MHHSWPTNRSSGYRPTPQLLYKPVTSSLAAAAAASAAAAAAAASHSAGNTGGLFAQSAYSSSVYVPPPAPVVAVSSANDVLADVYPLPPGRCPEDSLTALSMQYGWMLPYVPEETHVLSVHVPSMKDARLRLREKLLDASQSAPKKPRTTRSIPPLFSAGSKEQREEWLRQLAGDTPLSELSRSAPSGLSGFQLFEEMSARSVPIMRASWFMKLVAVQPDGHQGAMQRPLNAKQRNHQWTDDMKKFLSAAVVELSSCFRFTAAFSSGSQNIAASLLSTQISESAALAAMQSFDARAGSSAASQTYGPAIAALQATLEACGLEILHALPAGAAVGALPPGAGVAHAPQGMNRFTRAASRFLYALSFIEWSLGDGCGVDRASIVSWVSESLLSSAQASWGVFPNNVVKFFLFQRASWQLLPWIAQSRGVGKQIAQACVMVIEKFKAQQQQQQQQQPTHHRGGSAHSASVAPILLHNTRMYMTQCVTLLRAIMSAYPNSYSWWIDHDIPSLNSSAESSRETITLLKLVGGRDPSAFCPQWWQSYFPHFLTALTEMCTSDGSASILPHFTHSAPTLLTFESIPLQTIDWPAHLHISSRDCFINPAELMHAAAHSTSLEMAQLNARFLRAIQPHFLQGPLQLLLAWAIKGQPRADRAAIPLVTSILISYVHSSLTDALGAALLQFLCSYRPADIAELHRTTLLFAALSQRGIFPLEEFTHGVLCSGAAENTNTLNADTDLQDWITLGRFYVLHFNLPASSPLPHSLAESVLQPSRAYRALHPSTSSELPAQLHSLRALALGHDEEDIRAGDLVFFDILWLWEKECSLREPASVVSVLPAAFEQLHDERQSGSLWSISDRRSHSDVWKQRSSTSCLLHTAENFPASRLYMYMHVQSAQREGVAQSTVAARPGLQHAICSAAALVATLPLAIAQLTVDMLVRCVKQRVEQCNSLELQTLLRSPSFCHVCDSIFSVLETLDLSLSLQLFLQWLLAVLISVPESTHLDGVEVLAEVCFGCIRRNWQVARCSSADGALKKLCLQYVACEDTLRSAEQRVTMCSFPHALEQMLLSELRMRNWPSTPVKSEVHSADSSTWPNQLRSALSAGSDSSIADAVALVPLTDAGMDIFAKELMRGVIIGAITAVQPAQMRLVGAVCVPNIVRSLESAWSRVWEALILAHRRTAHQSHFTFSKCALRAFSNIWMSLMKIPTASESQLALTLDIPDTDIQRLATSPLLLSFPHIAASRPVQHLGASMALFLARVVTADFGSGWQLENVLQHFNTITPVDEQQKQSLKEITFILLGCPTPFAISLGCDELLLRLHCTNGRVGCAFLLPTLQSVSPSERVALLCSPFVQSLCLADPVGFATHILPLLSSMDEAQCSRVLSCLLHASATEKPVQSGSLIEQTEQHLEQCVSSWNIRTSVLAAQTNCILAPHEKTALVQEDLLRSVARCCLSDSQSSSPLVFGSYLELLRQWAPLLSVGVIERTIGSEFQSYFESDTLDFLHACREGESTNNSDSMSDDDAAPVSKSRVPCGCCCPSLIVTSLLSLEHVSGDGGELVVQLIDQCELFVSSFLSAPNHSRTSSLLHRFDRGVSIRLASIRSSLSMLLTSHAVDYERLLKFLLTMVLLVPDSPSALHPIHNSDGHAQPPVGSLFTRTLRSLQEALDVCHAAVSWCDPKDSSGARPFAGSSPNRVVSPMERMLLDLGSLLHTMCASVPLTDERRSAITRSFELVNGGSDDVQWLAPSSDASGQPSGSVPLSVQDPWLMLEGVASTPFIDLMHERSAIASQ